MKHFVFFALMVKDTASASNRSVSHAQIWEACTVLVSNGQFVKLYIDNHMFTIYNYIFISKLETRVYLSIYVSQI